MKYNPQKMRVTIDLFHKFQTTTADREQAGAGRSRRKQKQAEEEQERAERDQRGLSK